MWQQDDSKVHTASKVFECFEEEAVQTSDWPARSPDLSPIENVCKVLQDKVYELGQFKNKNELLKMIKRCAKQIDKQMIKNLYAGMNKRLVAVIEKKGDQI